MALDAGGGRRAQKGDGDGRLPDIGERARRERRNSQHRRSRQPRRLDSIRTQEGLFHSRPQQADRGLRERRMARAQRRLAAPRAADGLQDALRRKGRPLLRLPLRRKNMQRHGDSMGPDGRHGGRGYTYRRRSRAVSRSSAKNCKKIWAAPMLGRPFVC